MDVIRATDLNPESPIEDILNETPVQDGFMDGSVETGEMGELIPDDLMQDEGVEEMPIPEDNTDEDAPVEDEGKKESTTESIDDLDKANKELEDSDTETLSEDEIDKLLEELKSTNEEVSKDLDEDFSEEFARDAMAQKDATISTLNDKLQQYVSKNAKLAVDLAEQAMYSPSKVPEMVVMAGNIDKALEGDTAAIEKVMSTLSALRSKISSGSFDEDDMEESNDRVSKSGKMSGNTSPKKIDLKSDEEEIRVL